jgi:hypothetical protein
MFNLTYQPNGKISAIDNNLRPISIQEAVFEIGQLRVQLITEADGEDKKAKFKRIVKDLIAKIKAFFKGLALKITKSATEREKFVLENKGTILKYSPGDGTASIPSHLLKPSVKLTTGLIMSATSKVITHPDGFNSEHAMENVLKIIAPSYKEGISISEFFSFLHGEQTDVPLKNISPAQLIDSFLSDMKFLKELDKWETNFISYAERPGSYEMDHENPELVISHIIQFGISITDLVYRTVIHATNVKFSLLKAMESAANDRDN